MRNTPLMELLHRCLRRRQQLCLMELQRRAQQVDRSVRVGQHACGVLPNASKHDAHRAVACRTLHTVLHCAGATPLTTSRHTHTAVDKTVLHLLCAVCLKSLHFSMRLFYLPRKMKKKFKEFHSFFYLYVYTYNFITAVIAF